MIRIKHFIAPLLAILFITGCGVGSDAPVVSHLSGTLKVRPEVDSTDTFAGFRITVLTQTEGDVDTLGTAVTTEGGGFEMTVRAQESGVYPLVVERNGTTLSVSEFVAVDGDTVAVSGTYPLGARPLRIVSSENAAWTAYKNSKAGHNQMMLDVLESGAYGPEDIGRITTQTSTILWSIRSTYPGTMGAQISMAESIVMVEGWSDSTVIARYGEVPLDNPNIVSVVRAARRSVARVQGQDSSLALLDRYSARFTASQRAEILAERVLAHADSLEMDQAVAAASELRRLYPESEWAEWASRATYELENLQPGMSAPAYALVTRDGEDVSTELMDGKFVILEFYDPAEQIFQGELERRDGIVGALGANLFQTISVSVEPDEDINEALFEGQTHPGHFVFLGEGIESQIARDYNVQVLPTRYLIDPDGRIVAKYSGPALANLERDLVVIVGGLNDLAQRLEL